LVPDIRRDQAGRQQLAQHERGTGCCRGCRQVRHESSPTGRGMRAVHSGASCPYLLSKLNEETCVLWQDVNVLSGAETSQRCSNLQSCKRRENPLWPSPLYRIIRRRWTRLAKEKSTMSPLRRRLPLA